MEENISQEAEYPLVEEAPRGFNAKKIISLIIGFLVLGGLIATFFVFILPNFNKPQKPTDVSLTYWGAWENPASMEEIIQDFTRLHPNIKIKYEKQDIKALGKYYERLTTRINNGTGPDIFRFHNSWVTELKPYLLPLPQDVVSETELDSKFYPVISEDLKISGAYYGIPIHFDTLSLFINTQLLRAGGTTNYPVTWEDLTAIARSLTVKDSNGKIMTSGVALGTFDNIVHSSDIISLLLIQNGADLKDLNGPNKQNSIDALDFYTSFAKGDASIWDGSLENSKLAFAKGSLAMYFGYSWDIFEIKTLNPNLEFVVISVPRLGSSENARENTVASFWVEGTSVKTKYSEQAFEFLKYLGSREIMEKLYTKTSGVRLFGELYPRSDMADLLKSNSLVYPFVQQGQNARSTIFSSDTYDEAMVDSLNSYLGNAIRSIVDDNGSAQSAIETLSVGVSEVMGRYEETQSK